MITIYDYLTLETLPESEMKVMKIRCLMSRYLIVDKDLYKWGYSTPYPLCSFHPKSKMVLWEVHNAIVQCQEGARSIVYIRLWLDIIGLLDSWITRTQKVQKCKACWNFSKKWRKNTNIIYCIWRIFTNNIFSRWGIPRILISDNGPQFSN